MPQKPGGLSVPLKAGIPQVLTFDGRVIHVYQCTAEFTIAFDDEPAAPVDRGMSLEDGDGFKKITLLSQIDQNVVLTRSNGAVHDNRSAPVTFSGDLNLTAEQIAALQILGEVTPDVVAALKEKTLAQDTIDQLRSVELTAATIQLLTLPRLDPADLSETQVLRDIDPAAELILSDLITAVLGGVIANPANQLEARKTARDAQHTDEINTPAHISVNLAETLLVATADARRRAVIVQCVEGKIAIGHTSPLGATTGIILTAGERIELETSAPIYAHGVETSTVATLTQSWSAD